MRCPARKERAGQINIIISSGNYIHEKSRALSGGNARDTLKENNQPMSQTDWRPGRNCFKTINTRALYITYYISRGYRDNIDQKSGVFLDPLTLFLTLGGVDHRTVAQESRAAPAAPDSAGQRRTASGSIRSAGQRSGIAEIS